MQNPRPSRSRPRIRCLIVDDDPGILLLVRRWLEVEGVEVQTVESASAAWDLVRRQEFHAVITDMVMDGMDGIELLRHLKEAKVRPKVIGISGVAGGENLGRALLAMGGEGFLMKPFERSDLIEALEAALGRTLGAA
jgi:CheY-like chemotaxis protein